jgi:hypothetical protein
LAALRGVALAALLGAALGLRDFVALAMKVHANVSGPSLSNGTDSQTC